MKHFYIILLFFSCYLVSAQSIYDPTVKYDASGGLFDHDSLRSIYLDFYDPNYHQVLVSSWFYNPDLRIPAVLTINNIDYDSVGVRYKGNSTFCLPNDASNRKVPYNIDINYFVGGQKVMEYKKMKLANAWMDPTFMKQVISAKIYQEYLPTGESNLIKLFSQGNYVGMYVNDESINKQFLDKHFDEKKGPLFKCDNIDRFCDTTGAPSALPPNLNFLGDDSTLYYNSYDMKSDNGWTELVDLIRTIVYEFQNIDSVLNVDRTLWAFAANQTLQNLDCYNTYYVHNYYLYQTEDGLFQMIPWDLDNSFAGAIMGWNFWNQSAIYEYDPYYVGGPYTGPMGAPQPWEWRPLLDKLLNNDFYRKLYTAHLRTILNESFDTTTIRAYINDYQVRANNDINSDINKQFSLSQYYNNTENPIWTGWGFGGIMKTMIERKQFLMSHPEINYVPPVLTSHNFNNNVFTVYSSNTDNVELMVSTNKQKSKFKSFLMNDDGINGDLTAGDGFFSTTFDLQNYNDTINYYFRSENTNAISLLPERAEYFFFQMAPLSVSSTNPSKVTVKKLIEVVDVLGRATNNILGRPVIYIYDDGSVEKKILIK
tara:strand:- start:3394 stop:5181 length:1788 start_codon:yes stop_codon:yes gene_type:complete